jgi:threonine/homoserine/homoserine lactone efflux protein
MHPALLWKGAMLGVAIAAPVGPIGILTITRMLREGRAAGLLTGLGAACADAIYGAAAALGVAATAQPWMRPAGGAFLMALGVKLVLSKSAASVPAHAAANGRTFVSACLLTLSNPMTILSFAAMLGSFGVAGSGAAAFSLIAGVFLGSMAWWVALACGVSAVSGRIDSRWLTALNRVCGVTLAAFGVRALLP